MRGRVRNLILPMLHTASWPIFTSCIQIFADCAQQLYVRNIDETQSEQYARPTPAQVLKERGVEEAALDEAVRKQLQEADAARAAGDGVAAVLLESATAEVARLRDAAEGAAAAQASLQQLNDVRLFGYLYVCLFACFARLLQAT